MALSWNAFVDTLYDYAGPLAMMPSSADPAGSIRVVQLAELSYFCYV